MVALCVVVAALLFGPPLPVQTTAAGLLDEKSLDADAKKGQDLASQAGKVVETLGLTEVIGPLAPVALSPFFALTFMSGASVLSDTPIVPDFIKETIGKNAMVGKGSPLNNGFVFTGLLGLTVLTTLPKLTKVTKPLGQAIDQIEAHSGIIAVLAVQGLSRMNMSDGGGDQVASIVVQAGLWSASVSTVLMIFSAINIFVINTVKFFFEMMIFLSPFPSVDAIFETLNKSFAAFLLAVYLFSPWLATVINLTIFAICLLIFAWIHRRVVYLRSIFGDPLLGWFGETFFGRPKPTLTSTHLRGALAREFPKPTLVMKAFVGKSFGGLSTKARGFLVQSDGKLQFVCRRFMRAPLFVALPAAGHTVQVNKGFLGNSIVLENDAGDAAATVLFSRRYNRLLDDIRRQIGAEATSEAEAAIPAPGGVMAVSRTIGQAVKGGDRDSLRAELA